jgi:RimJ/RimL family protein N-acetyltransferase
MNRSAILRTERLILRHWRESDREPFARLNADPRVMEFMPHILSAQESSSLADRIEAHFRKHGFGLYAVELRRDGSFIGFIGLNVPSFHAAFMPCVEVDGDLRHIAGGKVSRQKGRGKSSATASRYLALKPWCPSRCQRTLDRDL